MIQRALLAGLNHVLGQSAWARDRLAPFAGRHAQLSMPPLQFGLIVTNDGRFEATDDGGQPDVHIILPAETPFLILQGQDRVMQAARVEGAAEFATELAFVLKNLKWDAEEDLSRLVGDVAAHRIVGGVAALTAWQKDAVARLTENLVAYVTEEQPLLLPSAELRAFSAELAETRAAVESAERRLDKLPR